MSENNQTNIFGFLLDLVTKKPIIILLYIVVFAFLIAIFRGTYFNFWGFEVNKPKIEITNKIDTLIQIKEKPTYINQSRESNLTLKQGDSLKITSNLPTQINTGNGTQNNVQTNNGIVGSNNTIINPKKYQRVFTQAEQEDFISQVYLHLAVTRKKLDTKIEVYYLEEDNEAMVLSKQLLYILKNKKYNVVEQIKPILVEDFKGVKVDADIWDKEKLKIIVGHADF